MHFQYRNIAVLAILKMRQIIEVLFIFSILLNYFAFFLCSENTDNRYSILFYKQYLCDVRLLF